MWHLPSKPIDKYLPVPQPLAKWFRISLWMCWLLVSISTRYLPVLSLQNACLSLFVWLRSLSFGGFFRWISKAPHRCVPAMKRSMCTKWNNSERLCIVITTRWNDLAYWSGTSGPTSASYGLINQVGSTHFNWVVSSSCCKIRVLYCGLYQMPFYQVQC